MKNTISKIIGGAVVGLALLIVLAGAAQAWSDARAGEACESSSDCEGILSCRLGVCQAILCSTDFDCTSDDAVCWDGLCSGYSCTFSNECPGSHVCNRDSHRCMPYKRDFSCTLSSDCESGEVCLSGRCEPVDEWDVAGAFENSKPRPSRSYCDETCPIVSNNEYDCVKSCPSGSICDGRDEKCRTRVKLEEEQELIDELYEDIIEAREQAARDAAEAAEEAAAQAEDMQDLSFMPINDGIIDPADLYEMDRWERVVILKRFYQMQIDEEPGSIPTIGDDVISSEEDAFDDGFSGDSDAQETGGGGCSMVPGAAGVAGLGWLMAFALPLLWVRRRS